MGDFVHLHLHTMYSLLDSPVELRPLLARVKDLGMPAVAITDHNALYGAVEFYQLAREFGIKPIIGCEVEVEGNHLVLLARNIRGYGNLVKLVSAARLGSREKPQVSKDLLACHSENIIALSGCLRGEISRLLLQGATEEARRTLFFYRELFGKDGFYLEIGDHGLPEEKQLLKALAGLALDTGTPLVATNDVHYLRREDGEAHDVLTAIAHVQKVDQPNPWKKRKREYYLKSPSEMAWLFAGCPEALSNTLRIAEACNVEIDLASLHLPAFLDLREEDGSPVEAGCRATAEQKYLRDLCEEGLKRLYMGASPEEMAKAISRLERELAIVKQMGFAAYFLIVRDMVMYAQKSAIPVGPGRGSGAGSLISYLLGITGVDPLKHNLFFERFLNPERQDMPDIDIDFCQRRRDEVLNYVKKRYGSHRVAHVGVYSTFGARAAVREVGKALNAPPKLVDSLAKAFPHFSGPGGIDNALATLPELQKINKEREPVNSILRLARAVEGKVRHLSTHAAALLITKENLTDLVPLEHSPSGELITQFDKDTVEALGLLKIDLLGLRNLTVIEDTLAILAEQGIELRREDIPMDGPASFELLRAGDTVGCFQIESAGMRTLMRKLAPENLEDLIALLSLYRPGPWDSGMVEAYIRRRHGEEEVAYLHPDLEPILKDTYGTILYQEQVMQVANVLAGFTLGEADLLRRAMTSRSPGKMACQRSRFIKGAQARGIDRELAEEIFGLLAKFAGYGFNKAHSTAYAYIVMQTVYLKAHYPAEYLSALMSSGMGFYPISVYLEEARRKGILLLPPHINKSEVGFTVERLPGREAPGPALPAKAIRVGLFVVKGLGGQTLPAILQARKAGGLFRSLHDFCRRVDRSALNRSTLQNLIRCGAFDKFGYTRPQLLSLLDYTLEDLRRNRQGNSPKQSSLGEMWPSLEEDSLDCRWVPPLPEYSPAEKVRLEEEMLGLCVSEHPLKRYRCLLGEYRVSSSGELRRGYGKNCDRSFFSSQRLREKPVTVAGRIVDCRRRPTKKGEPMLFLLLEDEEGLLEVTVFPKVYRACLTEITPQGILVKGTLAFDGPEPKVTAEKLYSLAKLARSKPANGRGVL